MTETATNPQIYDLIPKVMASIGEIGKEGKNQAQGYNFRGIDSALNYCGPAFVKHGVTPSIIVHQHNITIHDEIDKYNKQRVNVRCSLLLTLRLTAPDGSQWESTAAGEGQDYGSDKATNKAMSAAMKYALLLGLCMPIKAGDIEEGAKPQDSDRDAKEEAPAKSAPRHKAKPPIDATKPVVQPTSVIDARKSILLATTKEQRDNTWKAAKALFNTEGSHHSLNAAAVQWSVDRFDDMSKSKALMDWMDDIAMTQQDRDDLNKRLTERFTELEKPAAA